MKSSSVYNNYDCGTGKSSLSLNSWSKICLTVLIYSCIPLPSLSFFTSFSSTSSSAHSKPKYSIFDVQSSSSSHQHSNGQSHRLYVALSTPTTATSATSYSMQPADLTPAVDRYVRLPDSSLYHHNQVPSSSTSSPYAMQARGPAPDGPDPFKLVQDELSPLSDYVKELVVSENPVLTRAASHFFEQRQGKRFRPAIVGLFGRLFGTMPASESNGETVTAADSKAILQSYLTSPVHAKQLQLAQITEMIHVASLIHDDVLDEAEMRRGGLAVHTMYSNKVAVLAGDYLLARASVLLARLHHFQVVEVMASALDALVTGEIMQARSKKEELSDIHYYLRKSYFKTASLICSACRSSALLAGHLEGSVYTIAAEEYGYHLGMAFQIVDDILDFAGASSSLGKPAQADMSLGLATAPILFAAEEVKELKPLIERRFKEPGDVQRAVSLATKTKGIARSYDLAEFHADRAVQALMRLPNSETRQALMKVIHLAIARDK